MGLFGFKKKGPSFEEKEQKVEKKAFEPMDLNAENINKLAHLCGADKNSKFVYNIIFYQRKLGFPKDTLPITFDADIMDENAPTIFYLFGQLYTVHNNFHTLPVKDAAKKYDKTIWEKDKVAITYLLHLAVAAKVINPPDAKTKCCIMSSKVTPTLSPNDPNFPEWWEKHKSEWESK